MSYTSYRTCETNVNTKIVWLLLIVNYAYPMSFSYTTPMWEAWEGGDMQLVHGPGVEETCDACDGVFFFIFWLFVKTISKNESAAKLFSVLTFRIRATNDGVDVDRVHAIMAGVNTASIHTIGRGANLKVKTRNGFYGFWRRHSASMARNPGVNWK